MVNSHYVPQLILKKFSDKLCLYNIRTGEFYEDVSLKRAYSEKGFYDDETEKNLNLKIESQFGNLLANKILEAEKTIKLNRKELFLIKKFLLVSVIRSLGSIHFMDLEKHYYDHLREFRQLACDLRGDSEEEKRRAVESVVQPFVEKEIDGETVSEYWLRTLNVILDTDGSPEEIIKHPDKTYPAHRWANVIKAGYIAFWDSGYNHDEFVITDIGMTSENEKGWNDRTIHNNKKMNFLINLLQKENDETMKRILAGQIIAQGYFHENFQMFPISARRMIVLISPFYKFRYCNSSRYHMPELSTLTNLVNENLYCPNENKYVLPLKDGYQPLHPNDKYIYDIKKLTSGETIYCNELFMDRINTHLGFSSLNKAVKSIVKYKRDNSFPYVPRVDYTQLYKIIEERYGGNLNV